MSARNTSGHLSPEVAEIASQALTAALFGQHWPQRQRQIMGRFAVAFGGGLTTLSPATSVACALSAARAEAPMARPGFCETWSRVALVHCVRSLLCAAACGPSAPALFEAATAASIAALDALAEPSTELTAGAGPDPRLRAELEGLLEEATESMRRLSIEVNDLFAKTFYRSLSASLPAAVLAGEAPDAAVRAAVEASIAAARGGVRSDARLTTARCVAEAAGALVAPLAAYADPSTTGRACRLRLARVAGALLACADDTDARQDNDSTTDPLEEKPVMTTDKTTMLATLQNDASDAAWRAAGSQFVKLTRDPLVAMLSRHLGPDDAALRNKIAAFLDTEIGSALLASLLSVGLSAVPAVGGGVPQRLARELRVKAMADAGELVAEVVMGPLRQVMSIYLQDLGSMVEAVTPSLSAHDAGALGAAKPATRVVSINERDAARASGL